MDPFDDDINNFDIEAQLHRLEDQLEDEMRAEINMDIDIEVDMQLADQFMMDQLDAVRANPPVGQNGEQPGGIQQPAQQPQAGAVGQQPAEPAGNDGNAAAAVAGGAEVKTEEPGAPKKVEAEEFDPILTPKGSEMKGFSCMICYEPFNTKGRIPKVLPCGHTFCFTCVKGLMKNRSFLSSSTVICPTCRQNSRYSTTLGADKVPTNFCILSMLEQRNEEKVVREEEKEMAACSECQESFLGTELTLCMDDSCQAKVEDASDLDSIKRVKSLLICEKCVKANHPRHNHVPFEKVVAQYEVNQKVCDAEAALQKALRSADDALVVVKLSEREIADHQKRMANALENIRSEADHHFIYEYLNRFMTSVGESRNLFQGLIADVNHFDVKSKARYYRAFGQDSLRPISISTPTADFCIVKEEPREPAAAPYAGRDRLIGGNPAARARFARLNILGPFAAARNLLDDPLADADRGGIPGIDNILDRVMQQLDVPRGAPRARDLGAAFENMAAAAAGVGVGPGAAGVAGAAPVAGVAGAAPPAAGLLPPFPPGIGPGAAAYIGLAGAGDLPMPLLPNRMNMWAVRAPIVPRRPRRNDREIRVVRQNLIAAQAANPVLRDIPAIQQAIDALRDNRDEEGIIARRHLAHDNDAFGRELARAEDQLNRLRERLNRLEAADAQRGQPRGGVPAPVAPAPWVDNIVEDPLPVLPPIDGIDPEVIHRAEIHELVDRVRNMVRNEANAEAVANGQPLPENVELPPLVSLVPAPGAPDPNNLLVEQLEPFLADVRKLEGEWIQRGKDRRARAAAAGPAQPPAEEAKGDVQVNEVAQQTDQNLRADGDAPQQRPNDPTTAAPADEPAAKRNRH